MSLRSRSLVAVLVVLAALGGGGWWSTTRAGKSPAVAAPSAPPQPVAHGTAEAGRTVAGKQESPESTHVAPTGRRRDGPVLDPDCTALIAWQPPDEPGWREVVLDLEGGVLPRGVVSLYPSPALRWQILQDGGDSLGRPVLEAPLAGWRFYVPLCATSSVAVELEDGRRAWASISKTPVHLKPSGPLPRTRLAGRLVRGGAPVSGVTVSGLLCPSVTTEADGRFELECVVLPHTEALTLSAPWYFRATDTGGMEADGGALGDLEVRRRTPVAPGMVGMALEPLDGGGVFVADPMAGGPAQLAGVRRGDVVLEVDGVGVQRVEEAIPRILGVPGTRVRLKLRRGADVLLLELERQRPDD